ncbi:hypothetical protein [Burkholderia multivorans]|uniref:hypothetical protein n=1 Tax=Burkholderia multivorans TaxID=87883 RepID=UPI001C2170F7|nr:hypothetical protein [Burkholderia multivorans]MBU9553868.1 hypothetical protein [Burkholderia multivorans]
MRNEKQTTQIQVKATESMKQDMVNSAKELNLSLSTYIKVLHTFSKDKREEMKRVLGLNK